MLRRFADATQARAAKPAQRMYKTRTFQQLSLEEIALIPLELTECVECLHCGYEYKEYANYGRLACRLHPGIIEIHNGHRYSCCQKPHYSVGCLKSDHIKRGIPLSIVNEEERHKTLFDLSTIVLPIDYFYYGIMQPLFESILFSTKSSHQRKVLYVVPLQNGIKKEFDVEEELYKIRTGYRKMPLLKYHYKKNNCDIMEKRKRANQGWKNDIGPDAILGNDSDSEEDELGNYTKIDIPFIIVKRVSL